ncbi:MAG TPA: hypothetical protein VMH05_04030 [Bryobacteraceae bacterium]|nr:hypothetical protein [Bryobacteraceae bacterium]
MISVILYGRNDSHGYNLHKRAAMSINCIAEVLSDPDDEILFVDCNTSNDLPTFIEAVYDTLTPRAKEFLRVLRMRPKLYYRMVGQTHLPATEPHTRNVALRRSNPRNRWVLSTNTDMIFVLEGGYTNLADMVRDLPDAQYVAPRMEVPEPLWESFPRSNPREAMRLCQELGPKLHLHEVALRVPYMRFDSPGDFQLMPRQTLFDVCGFDERMTHGWHADSNMCKRLYLYFGQRTKSLSHLLKGYHCDHTRVATGLHQMDIKLENNLQQFVWDCEEPIAHHQAESWGAPNDLVEEVDFTNGPAARYICALDRTLGGPQPESYPADANDARNFVYYPQEHALPYLAGNFTVYPRNARFLYAGNNPLMLDLVSRCVQEMGFTEPLDYVADLLSERRGPVDARAIQAAQLANGASFPEHILENYNPVIFDFGLDRTGLDLGLVRRVTDWPRELRYSIGAVARLMEACAEQGDALWRERGEVPDFLVLNANHYVFQRFVGQLLLSTETPYPLHVRKGRPRVGEERRYRGVVWKYTEDLLCSYFAYDQLDHSVPGLAPGDAIDFTSEGHSARYKDGHWGAMDYSGTWTDGHTAAILFAPPESLNDDLVAYVRINEAFPGLDEEPIRLRVFFEGESLIRWTVYTRFEVIVCKAQLPRRLMEGKKVCRLELQIENPQSPQAMAEARGERIVNEDPRELGVKVQTVTFLGTEKLKYSVGEGLDFTEAGQGADHTNECWSQPDNYGQWTLGPEANLVFLLSAPFNEPVRAIFEITDVAVNADHPLQHAEVLINGRAVADWTLGPARSRDERTILLPEGLPAGPVLLSFRIPSPRSPVQLKWSTWDKRPLGFRLTSFRMEPAGRLKYRLGDVIDLTASGNASTLVGDALGIEWAQPDQFGSWTIGDAASLNIVFEQPPSGGVAASFIISDCMVSKSAAQLAVRVRANGQAVGEWTLGPARAVHRRSLELPAEAVAGRAELKLTFEIATPRSPESLGWGGDSRPLGLRLARVSIGGGEVPMPAFGKRLYIVRRLFARLLGLPDFARHHLHRVVKWWYER